MIFHIILLDMQKFSLQDLDIVVDLQLKQMVRTQQTTGTTLKPSRQVEAYNAGY